MQFYSYTNPFVFYSFNSYSNFRLFSLSNFNKLAY